MADCAISKLNPSPMNLLLKRNLKVREMEKLLPHAGEYGVCNQIVVELLFIRLFMACRTSHDEQRVIQASNQYNLNRQPGSQVSQQNCK